MKVKHERVLRKQTKKGECNCTYEQRRFIAS